MFSPTLVVMGAGHRWNALRKGTSMHTSAVCCGEDGRRHAEIQVSAPEPVFTPEFGLVLRPILEVALASSHGVDPSVEPLENASRQIRYLGSWAA